MQASKHFPHTFSGVARLKPKSKRAHRSNEHQPCRRRDWNDVSAARRSHGPRTLPLSVDSQAEEKSHCNVGNQSRFCVLSRILSRMKNLSWGSYQKLWLAVVSPTRTRPKAWMTKSFALIQAHLGRWFLQIRDGAGKGMMALALWQKVPLDHDCRSGLDSGAGIRELSVIGLANCPLNPKQQSLTGHPHDRRDFMDFICPQLETMKPNNQIGDLSFSQQCGTGSPECGSPCP